jgi:hypothetical protein
MNQEWSDTESSDEDNELIQPNRDFPISSEEDNNSEEEYEDEEFDIYELAKKTANKNMADDLFIKEEKPNINKSHIKKVELKVEPKVEKIIKLKEKRKFNPRLPPPNKYNKNHNNKKFNFNLNDFPTL